MVYINSCMTHWIYVLSGCVCVHTHCSHEWVGQCLMDQHWPQCSYVCPCSVQHQAVLVFNADIFSTDHSVATCVLVPCSIRLYLYSMLTYSSELVSYLKKKATLHGNARYVRLALQREIYVHICLHNRCRLESWGSKHSCIHTPLSLINFKTLQKKIHVAVSWKWSQNVRIMHWPM